MGMGSGEVALPFHAFLLERRHVIHTNYAKRV